MLAKTCSPALKIMMFLVIIISISSHRSFRVLKSENNKLKESGFHQQSSSSMEIIRRKTEETKCGTMAAQDINKGMALCTGNKMISDALAVVEQTRKVFNSNMNIAIVHCDELDDNTRQSFLQFPNITLVNMCNGQGLFGMKYEETKRRLRSWFCKTAAVVLSPFNETMVVDLDVVFFKKPDLLFNAPAYEKTGTLFFRDRLTFSRKKQSVNDKILQDVIEEYIVKHSAAFHDKYQNLTSEVASAKLSEDGVSYFWRNILDRSQPTLDNFQDSSVILVDKTRHPKFLQVLSDLLPTFNLGYGDKEIYWVSAIISGEPYSFEPFITGLYGDCGLLLHYDPRQANTPNTATPFYMNGEWILEKGHSVGHDLEFQMPNPTLATHNFSLFDLHSSRGCSCKFMGCRSVPENVNMLMTRAIWERLSRRVNHEHIPVAATAAQSPQDLANRDKLLLSRCVEIWPSEIPLINSVIEDMIRFEDCPKFGCPFVPLPETFRNLSESICVPVSFAANGPDVLYKKLTESIRVTPVLKDRELVKGSGKAVYIYLNDSLHMIPDADTFESLGLRWGDIHSMSDNKIKLVPMGEDIPPCQC